MSLMTREQKLGECAEVRRAMSLGKVAARFRPGDRAMVEAHLETCDACRDYQMLDPCLRGAFDRLRVIEAPECVRGWVVGALAVSPTGGATPSDAPQRSPRAGRVVWSGAAGILLALGHAFSLLMLNGAPADSPYVAESPYMEDYMRRATAAERIESSDPGAVSHFLSQRLGIELVPITHRDLHLEGAEVCLLDGEFGALILYKVDGVVVSHYLIPRPGRWSSILPSQERGSKLLGERVTVRDHPSVSEEVNVVTWTAGKVEQALVSALPAPRLAALVRP